MTLPAACRRLFIIFGLSISLASCAQAPEPPAEDEAVSQAEPAMAAGEASAATEKSPTQTSAPVRRYIAKSQQISMRIPGNNLQSTWEMLQQQALQLDGEVVTASLDNSNGGQAIAGIKVRIPPAKLDQYIALLKKAGNITSQTIGSEDKTNQVIDIDARMKNLSEARDQLRNMLAERRGNLSDVLEVQKALTETQTELDSLAGQRKALEAITSRVTLDIELHGTTGMNKTSQSSDWDNILDNWRSIGYFFVQLMLGIVSILPVILPLGLIGWFFWRRGKRQAAQKLAIARAEIVAKEVADKETAKDESSND